MRPLTSLVRISNALVLAAFSMMTIVASGAQITFDPPGSIECRDVTSKEFACAHPNLKTIEGKFQISDWTVEGTSADIIDLVYTFKTDETMRIQDYSPKTTLESAVEEDHIEITDAKENSTVGGIDGHVTCKPLILSGSHSETSKKSEASHYKQIAAKDTVLSSGTIDREHGVVFRIRPSRKAALEGAKEFTFVAVVPKTWRGDFCTITCVARTTKHNIISTSVVSAGAKTIPVGMFLSGDAEAGALAEELRIGEGVYEDVLIKSKASIFQTFSAYGPSKSKQLKKLQDAENAVLQTRSRLKELAR
jgi:hypothetical protein